MSKINIEGIDIEVFSQNDNDFICLTDMVRDRENNHVIIGNWMKSKDTLEYLGAWEVLNNPDFKLIEFDEFRNNSGTNRFSISPKQWIEKTKAVGVTVKSGRYGGTYAHKDIAFEFGAWLSPMFKLLLIREFQRLKNEEAERLGTGWDVRRFVSKANYKIQTDAIKDVLVPISNLPKNKIGILYAEEAELVNFAMFGMTAKDWKQENPTLCLQGRNMRDYANTHQLVVLANLESLNAEYIKSGESKEYRIKKLREVAISQLKSLSKTKDIEHRLADSPNNKLKGNPKGDLGLPSPRKDED